MQIYIYSDGHVVHAWDANDYDHQIMSGNLSTEFNRSGSLTFSVPPNNEAHKNGWIKDFKSVICVKNIADDFEWYGRVLNRAVDFMGCCTYTCEGALGRLNDMPLFPLNNPDWYKHHYDSNNQPYTDTNPCPDLKVGFGPLFNNGIIAQYNNRLDSFQDTRFDYYDLSSQTKKFLVSYYGEDWHIQDKQLIKNAAFENMFDYIHSNILNYGDYGYHLEMGRRKVNGVDYDLIFLRSNDPRGTTNNGVRVYNFKTAKKALIFGKNLTGFSYKTDYAELRTAMHFKTTVTASYNGQDYSTTREWVYPLEDSGIYNPTTTDDGVIAKYGLLMGHEELSGDDYKYVSPSDSKMDIERTWNTAAEAFKKDAKKRAQELMRIPTETIELNGVNITENDDTIPFRVNQYIPVISSYHNICAKYLCTSASFDLCNPANNQFILGAKPDSTGEKWTNIAKQPLEDPALYY